MKPTFRETEEFKRGRAAELLVGKWLQDRGFYVIPSYDYAGDDRDKPPRLTGKNDAFPVPDLDVAKAASRYWVEVKAKRKADWTYTTRRLEHGISERLYCAYARVQHETGCKVFLAVYEMECRELLIASIEKLSGDVRRKPMYGEPMVWFPRAAFRNFGALDAPDLEAS